MLIDLFFLISGNFLAIVANIFNAISFAIPLNIIGSITYFMAYLGYLRGIFPIYTLMQDLGVLMIAWVLMYTIKLFIHTILPLVPIIGKYIHLPSSEESRYKPGWSKGNDRF